MDNATVGFIALICTLIGAAGTFLTQKRNFKQDTKEETGNFTRVEAKLDYVSKGVDDIRLDMRDHGRQLKDLTERVVRVEESTKSAHHRIDGIEKED
jgi:uncharacterized membrane protein